MKKQEDTQRGGGGITKMTNNTMSKTTRTNDKKKNNASTCNIYLSWYDITEVLKPIMISLIKDYCYQESYWTKGS